MVGDKTTEYSVIFTLPNNIWKTKVKCRSQHVVESEGTVQVGTAFVKPNFSTFSTLQKYLIFKVKVWVNNIGGGYGYRISFFSGIRVRIKVKVVVFGG